MLSRPAWYKKLKQQTFEYNSDRFRTNLDPFVGVFRLPSGNNNESLHKTDCCNVLSFFWLEVRSAIFYHNFFSRFSRPILVRKIRLKSLKRIYRYLLTADSNVIKTTKKDWKELTVESWSQKFGSMAGLGTRICQRMLTYCCFWYFFFAIFFQSHQRPNTATFSTIWIHNKTVHLKKILNFCKRL